jgi:tRNA wybutosine-synthesizing protein 3
MRTTNETSPDARAADDFDARKSAAMAELVFADDADAERADRSRAGRVDARATACVRAVCASRDYFTTSSCSGRVSAFGEPKTVCKTEDGSIARDGGQVNKGGVWAYVSHDPANAEDVLRAVREVEAADAKDSPEGDGSASEGTTLVLRFEPFILSCRGENARGGGEIRQARARLRVQRERRDGERQASHLRGAMSDSNGGAGDGEREENRRR